MKESEELIDDIKAVVVESIEGFERRDMSQFNYIKNVIKDNLAKLPVEEAVIVSVAPPSANIMPKVGEMSAAPRPSTREKSGLDKAKSQKEARPEKS